MSPFVLLMAVLAVSPVQTKLVHLAPVHRDDLSLQRTDGRERAVILIHGFKPQPFSDQHVCRPDWHSWQRPGSELLKVLGRDADVFGFAYGQNAPIGQIARSPALAGYIYQVKTMGYREIVIIGHSAGG